MFRIVRVSLSKLVSFVLKKTKNEIQITSKAQFLIHSFSRRPSSGTDHHDSSNLEVRTSQTDRKSCFHTCAVRRYGRASESERCLPGAGLCAGRGRHH